jgi:NAD(P)H-hydrate epimerase
MDDNTVATIETEAAAPVTSAQMKEIERMADAAGLSYYQMMENAGDGAAALIDKISPVSGKKILIVCGKGNNGGDGFVVARKFHEWGAHVYLILAEGEPKTEDAIKNRRLCEEMAIPMSSEIRALNQEADLIIDAIYGTGFHGGLREPVRSLIRQINRSDAKVWALDIPSGLNGDSCDADEDTVRADGTIVFHRLKPAHADAESRQYCGEIRCISIGIETVLKD